MRTSLLLLALAAFLEAKGLCGLPQVVLDRLDRSQLKSYKAHCKEPLSTKPFLQNRLYSYYGNLKPQPLQMRLAPGGIVDHRIKSPHLFVASKAEDGYLTLYDLETKKVGFAKTESLSKLQVVSDGPKKRAHCDYRVVGVKGEAEPYLALRKGPKGELIAKLKEGESVEMIGGFGKWPKVKTSKGLIGFAYKKYLKKECQFVSTGPKKIGQKRVRLCSGGNCMSQSYLWQDEPINAKRRFDYAEAKRYCRQLRLNGVTNWELPSFFEAQMLPKISFAHTANGAYLTTTSLYDSFKKIKLINPVSSRVSEDYRIGRHFVRCVAVIKE